MSDFHQDEMQLEVLKSGSNTAWKQFYDDMRTPFRSYFMKYGSASPEEAISLFHEAMVVLHQKITTNSLVPPLSSSLKTYLIGIGKMLSRRKGLTNARWDDNIPEVAAEAAVEIRAERQEKAALVRDLLSRMGEPCRKILQLVYIQGYVMEAVARELDLPSEGAARKRKFDCLQKMRNLLE